MKDSLAERSLAALRRESPGAAKIEKAEAAFGSHLRSQASALADALGFKEPSFHQKQVDVGLARAKASQYAALFQSGGMMDFKLTPGAQLLSPPYDTSWQEGTGTPLSNWDGACLIIGSEGFSASGFGIHLRSDRHVSVSVMPQGRFSGGWANLGPRGDMRSAGGTGTVVYSDGQLLLDRRTILWDVREPAQFSGGNVDMPFAETATPPLPGSLGAVRLAPVLFEMFPGQDNLVWFYVWQMNHGIEHKSFLAFSDAKVPAVSVTVGDPLFIH